jgi:hypothetical protein
MKGERKNCPCAHHEGVFVNGDIALRACDQIQELAALPRGRDPAMSAEEEAEVGGRTNVVAFSVRPPK